MKRLLLAILTSCLCLTTPAQSKVNLDSLYKVLDAAIDSADIYLQRKVERIDVLKRDYQAAKTDSDKYHIAERLSAEYEAFENDSAMAYQYACIDMAEKAGREDWKARATMALAIQLANTGFYNEALIHFGEVAEDRLTGGLLDTYWVGMRKLYSEMGFYSHDPRLNQQFHRQATQIQTSLLERLDTTSVLYFSLRIEGLLGQNKPAEALACCDKWQAASQPDSRQFATMAYWRSEIYKGMGEVELQRYWLIQAALSDIRNAIMDQGALWSLANSLIREGGGNTDRANKYVNFSWQCLMRFSTHMRSWLVAPVVICINGEYKEQLQKANNELRWTVGIISLLMVGILLLLVYSRQKRRQLATARNELKSAYDELHLLNGQLSEKNQELEKTNLLLSDTNTLLSDANQLLSDTNEQLRHAIVHLNDSNRVKDEYIGKFLTTCSEYIDKLDNYRIKVNRKLKANQYNDLLRITESEQLKENELKELFNNFDAIFLRLFPSFINDFNALLRPEERIVPPSNNQLNTDLRIFALIRLGIDESSRIAEFLHYSPNSIYAYRARIKNKALGNRDDFEKQVKEIGVTS